MTTTQIIDTTPVPDVDDTFYVHIGRLPLGVVAELDGTWGAWDRKGRELTTRCASKRDAVRHLATCCGITRSMTREN